jgi:flagellar hook-associated protein 1 FlgK
MASLNAALETGSSSLLALQKRLAVTGNNIANAGTAGYHRRTATVSPRAPVPTATGFVGTGVRVDSVSRDYDAALERSLWQAVSRDAYYSAYTRQVSLLEQTLTTEEENAVQQAMTDFTNAWQNLATDPQSTQARRVVVEQGTRLARAMNMMRADMDDMRESITDSRGTGLLQESVARANGLATEIANVNRQIMTLEGSRFNAGKANDLRDRRDQLVRDLSDLVDVTVDEQENGSYSLTVDGAELVTGDRVRDSLELSVAEETPGLLWAGSGQQALLEGGEIHALEDAHAYLSDRIAAWDSFVSTMGERLNAAHAQGFDLGGDAGGVLFDVETPDRVVFMVTDIDTLAASVSPALLGDSSNAQAVWDVLNAPVDELGRRSLLSFPDRFVDELAGEVVEQQLLADGAAAGVTMFENAIQSISHGVMRFTLRRCLLPAAYVRVCTPIQARR